MRLASLVLFASIAITGCKNVTSSEPAYIRGTITSLDTGSYGVKLADGSTKIVTYPRILVEEDPSKTIYDAGYSKKSYVSLNGHPTVSTDAGRQVSSENLKVGQIVSVWITGTVLDSYPDQVAATRVVIESN